MVDPRQRGTRDRKATALSAPANAHFRFVNRWIDETFPGLQRDETISSFDKALAAVWRQGQLILGEVTMQAVADRVLHIIREHFSWLSPPTASERGITLSTVLSEAEGASDAEITSGLHFLLGEILTVLGSLSGEVISQSLHKAILESSAVAPTLPVSSREERHSESSDNKDRRHHD